KPFAPIYDMGGASHGQAETTLGPQGQPVPLGIREHTVFMALRISQRRQHKTIGHVWTALEGEG
ncbi:MAG: hypothetical protein ACO3T7_03660, partial [Pseudomonadales bacterium]